MKIIKLGKRVFRNISFRGKLLLVLLIGVVPMIVGFSLFGKQLNEMVSYQNEYALRQNFQQVYQSVDNQIGSMIEVANFLLADEAIHEVFGNSGEDIDAKEGILQYRAVEDTRRIFVDSDSVDDIVFYLDSSFPMTGVSVGNNYRDINIISGQDWFLKMREGECSSFWGSINCDPVIGAEHYISYLHTITDANNYSELNGVVSINLAKGKLDALMIPIFEEQSYVIQSDTGILVATRNEIVQRIPVEGRESFQCVEIDGIDYYCISSELSDSGFVLITCIPEKMLSGQAMESIYGLVLILIIVVLVICTIYILLANRLSQRIIHLAEVCRESEGGTLLKVREDESLDEIGVLSRAYNSMIDRIDYLLKEQFRIGEEIKDAQLKALQAQINPHFLYNTLEMISWMVAREDKKSAQGIIRSLTRYYKSVLNKGKDEIDILDEIRMGEAYMDIQSCRFKGKIDFRCEIEDSIGNLMVPKLILQPLLENSIFHGIGKKESGRGTIWLRAYKEEEYIVVEVSDDGVGFRYESQTEEPIAEPNKNDKLHPGSKYGLYNIKRRIVLFFEGDGDVKVESTPGIGTSVYIMLPATGKKQEAEKTL